jgi:hypothetical protein
MVRVVLFVTATELDVPELLGSIGGLQLAMRRANKARETNTKNNDRARMVTPVIAPV